MRILVVEDDQLLNKTLSYNLSAVGYSVDGAMSKAVAIRFLEKQDYDLIVLDVNLPDGNGFDICREVKERRPDTAVIFLTANDMESDMLKGFELGADDYVTKPFPISVFQKKVSALLNRISAQSGGDFYDDGNLYINFSELSACLAGQPITLTSLEYRLLKVLTRNSQTVLTRQVLLEKLWDKNFMDEVVQMLALGDKLQNMPNNLSGGQQQRVAIARALVSKPAIILADEPTGNLDSRTSSDVLGLLKVTSQKFHQTIVMITHNSEIAQLADRIVRIEDGKIAE